MLLVVIAMLVIAILFDMQIGYYTILRIVVSGVFVYVLTLDYARHDKGVFWLSIVIIIIFNPVFPVHFEKSTWRIIDFIIALPVYCLFSYITNLEKKA